MLHNATCRSIRLLKYAIQHCTYNIAKHLWKNEVICTNDNYICQTINNYSEWDLGIELVIIHKLIFQHIFQYYKLNKYIYLQQAIIYNI